MIRKFKNDIKLLTEKGLVKADIRKKLVAKADSHRDLFAGATKVKDGLYEIEWQAPNGESVFMRFEITVSNKSASELAPKTRKAKAKADSEPIEVE